LDLDTVRLERVTEPSGWGWRVLAGDSENPILVGFLKPVLSRSSGRRSSRWTARTAYFMTVPLGPWRNRTDVLVSLVDGYQRSAGV
jgi:hypothetical protein